MTDIDKGFKILKTFDYLDEYFSGGDPEIRKWFLINSSFWPFFLCGAYFLTVIVVGPFLMRNRKPFELRKTMIVYNLFVVSVYLFGLIRSFYLMTKPDAPTLCESLHWDENNETLRELGLYVWIAWMLKYVEFLDTVFFVLRKKNELITNLHVFHHTLLPILGWIVFRTEINTVQCIPTIVNTTVHIFMYGYYGLAAFGPRIRRYLWWKRYITLMQMSQFIIIIFITTVVGPLTGCHVIKQTYYLNITLATIFFMLFLNYYVRTFRRRRSKNVPQNGHVDSSGIKND